PVHGRGVRDLLLDGAGRAGRPEHLEAGAGVAVGPGGHLDGERLEAAGDVGERGHRFSVSGWWVWAPELSSTSSWPGSRSTPVTPSGSVVSTVSRPSSTRQPTSTRPCRVSRAVRAWVSPPPGRGATSTRE